MIRYTLEEPNIQNRSSMPLTLGLTSSYIFQVMLGLSAIKELELVVYLEFINQETTEKVSL